MRAFHRAWYSWVTHNQFDQQPHRTGTCWSLMTALLMIFGMPVLVSCCCTAGASSYGALMRSRSTRYTEASDAYLALALRGAAVDGLSHVAMVAATVALLHAAAGVTHCPLSALLNSALAWRRRGRARTWAATADSCRSRRRSPRYRQRSVPRASHAHPRLSVRRGTARPPCGLEGRAHRSRRRWYPCGARPRPPRCDDAARTAIGHPFDGYACTPPRGTVRVLIHA